MLNIDNVRKEINLDNVKDGDTVHQRCLLVTGTVYHTIDDPGNREFVLATTYMKTPDSDTQSVITFPETRWPISCQHFTALVILNPGPNIVSFSTYCDDHHDALPLTLSIEVNYVPLLQNPPLHLAILIASDSPLQIDCPPGKYGDFSTTHKSLDAVIAKFRLAAYMWQAMTAEDLRSKGLGRRSFRIEEDWAKDTLSSTYTMPSNIHTALPAMRSTAKVHLIRTTHTVAQLRDISIAQQNPNAWMPDELHKIFSKALQNYGGVFESSARPIVAGLILDSHYSVDNDMILGHAAVGNHNPNGLSLGVFGSHLTYSWPRYMEEVAECLLDYRAPGEKVGNDNGECRTMWEACSVGQGAFLHEVGHAFSASHTSGVMQRGYAKDWPKVFLSRTAYSGTTKQEGMTLVGSSTSHECKWDIRDALRFANLQHFRLPGDGTFVPHKSAVRPQVKLDSDEDFPRFTVSAASGIARIFFNGEAECNDSIRASPNFAITYTLDELESRFKRTEPLVMEILGNNGKEHICNVWSLFSQCGYLRVPEHDIVLRKKSIGKPRPSANENEQTWDWAVMLTKRGKDGKLYNARKIDIRVGAGLDGAIVYYHDESKMPCGPRYDEHGCEMGMGGHQARKLALPKSAEIVKVQVTGNECDDYSLQGLRVHLSNGKAMGALNKTFGGPVHDLEPAEGHKIIGFYGSSYRHGMCSEFGIVTAPRDIELPDMVWDLPELNNTDGGLRSIRKKTKMNCTHNTKHDWSRVEESDISEDEDQGYDDDGYYNDGDLVQDDGSEDDSESECCKACSRA